jgi:hypothetical protein
MKRLLLGLAAFGVALALPGEQARAIGQCGIPTRQPVWIDFADGSTPFWELFAKPGNVVAASALTYPPQIRELGAKTVFFDLYLNNRIGTPSAPKNPATIEDRALRMLDFAIRSSACDKPLIALNEMFGANLETPWSATNTQYRANLMQFLRTLAERGARPFLLISSAPYTSGEAADWWREAARYADLVPEVYFSGPIVHREGAIVGSRRLRVAMRRAVRNFTSIGIPASKVGIMLGFQTKRGAGGREGLEPEQAWFDVVKWQALAARQVARETGISTIWSWGWAVWATTPKDPDKEPAACVYLWTRNPALCDGPAAAGPDWNTSRTEGQIRLAPGRQCTSGAGAIDSSQVSSLQRLTGDRDVAETALLARLAEARYARVKTESVLAAERAVVALRFAGRAAAYRSALAAAGATVAVARGVLADELRRLRLEATMPFRRSSPREVSAFYLSYPELLARSVEVKPAPWWLGGRTRGLAIFSLAPEQVFGLPLGRRANVRALEGSYSVRALGEAQPLGSVPFAVARPGIAAALDAFARRDAFESWTVGRQRLVLQRAICRGDELPAPGTVRLTGYLPFLSLGG